MPPRFWLFLAVLLGLLLPVAPASAQKPIVVSQSLEINFPRNMQFHIHARSGTPIQVLRLTVWQRGVALGSRHTPPFTPATDVQASFSWNFQSFSYGGYLPPGTHGEYTWHIEDSEGNVYDTPRQPYVVQDRTQNWQSLADENLRVNWHAGDAGFGTAILNRAQLAHRFLSQELGIENVNPLEIFIYADKQDFFQSLPPFSYEWTGGRMFPEYGVIMIQFAPDNLEWGLRATSHELSHAILHAKIRGTIGELSVPHWLDEGLAVYNETDDHAPDDQFDEAFQLAARRNVLIPLRRLQNRFPDNSIQAQLAYGQSYSVVKFMIEKYGREKFAQLLDIYQQGAQPDDGLVRVYDMNQDELENAWRAEIGAPLREFSTSNLPTVAPRPTYEFSSPLTTSPAPTKGVQATVEPTRIAVAVSPQPGASIPASQPTAPASELCGGALVLSGLVAWDITRRKSKTRADR